MSKKHSYKNPSKKQDLGHVEAQVTQGKKYYDEHGWGNLPPLLIIILFTLSDLCLYMSKILCLRRVLVIMRFSHYPNVESGSNAM